MQFGWQRRAHAHGDVALRVLEADAVGMQEQPAQREPAHLRVEFGVAVFLVARHGMTCIGRVHADLVRASGEQPHLQQRGQVAEELHHAELACRFLAAG
jgi:hypothetical protein